MRSTIESAGSRARPGPDRPRRGVRPPGAVGMSLRRRIAGAAALAVAAVAIAVAVIGYVSTRSHLISQTQSQLRARAAPALTPHDLLGGPAGGPGGAPGR